MTKPPNPRNFHRLAIELGVVAEMRAEEQAHERKLEAFKDMLTAPLPDDDYSLAAGDDGAPKVELLNPEDVYHFRPCLRGIIDPETGEPRLLGPDEPWPESKASGPAAEIKSVDRARGVIVAGPVSPPYPMYEPFEYGPPPARMNRHERRAQAARERRRR